MDMKEIRNEKSGSLEPTGSKLTTKLGRWTIVAPAICLFSLVAGLSAICNEVWLLFAGLLYLSAMTSLFYFVQGKLRVPWIFDQLDTSAGSLAVLFWWEIRRPAYNVLMSVLFLGTNLLWISFAHATQNTMSNDEFVVIIAIVVYGVIVWNICYCLGFVADLILRRLLKMHKSAALLKLGIAGSVTVLTFPAVLWGFIWLFERLSSVFVSG